ncbi:MAG: hydroxymethylglutaryl-CoA reductase, degradative [Candidatus Micrarchaeota archaeon]|nr:hydroxymethylglutaryl-CoA reductase, degradative [Candidatus Micrarchaeota archaeon]
MQSDISGFYAKSPSERLSQARAMLGLSDDDVSRIASGGLTIEEADVLRENVIGLYSLPLSIATNFKVNTRDYLVPMAGEEPSVVAAASKAAKMAREFGGFTASSTDPIMIGEVLIRGITPGAAEKILVHKEPLLRHIDDTIPSMKERGGGARDVWARTFSANGNDYMIVYFSVDVRDAMGANTVNKAAESLAQAVTGMTGGTARMCILTNLSVKRISRAKAYFTSDNSIIEGVLDAQAFAQNDIFRAVTHNKGIMNGISGLALATGNDTRGVEAAAHGYAAYSGAYRPLTKYYVEDGKLAGEIEVPLSLGIVGSGTGHKVARICIDKILRVRSAPELCNVAAAVGLAQNFAALRALTQEGINKGHMRLHSKTLALMAGATPSEAAAIYEMFRGSEDKITMSSVKEALEKLRAGKRA